MGIALKENNKVISSCGYHNWAKEHYKLLNLKAEHILKFYPYFSTEKGISNGTIVSVHRVLRDPLNLAVKWEKLPKLPKGETLVWNENEVKQLLEFTRSSRYHIIVSVK